MPNFKVTLALGLTALTGASAGTFVLCRHDSKIASEAVAVPSAKSAAALTLDLAAAIAQGHVRAEFMGNGKDKLTFTAHNNGAQPLRLHLPAGQLFTSPKSTVALARSLDIDIEPNARRSEELHTVATSSANAVEEVSFALSSAEITELDGLWIALDRHAEIPLPAAQVATLALTENLPLSAFAKFSVPNGGAGSRLDTMAFKTDTSDILTALVIMRIDRLDERIALKIDPQLKIEAMIDPLAHALAVRYYNIGDEWAYWKNELLEGDLATRHYALFGIARFYPEIALQMLPRWARAEQTSVVFRTSAIQALAETQRPEAVPILRRLEVELGAASELGKVAQVAANFLDTQFSKNAPAPAAVAFRSSKPLAAPKAGLTARN